MSGFQHTAGAAQGALEAGYGRRWRDWAAISAALVIAGALLYLGGFEQGAVAIFDGTMVHELVHDARHALGFPCH